MKKIILPILAAMSPALVAITFLITEGCCTTDNKLVMERTVPVKDYSKSLSEMVEDIERDNVYEANDVKSSVYGNRVTIRVFAERMRPIRSYQRQVCKLQNEVCACKKKISELEKQLEDARKVPVTVSTNGNVSVDLRGINAKIIAVH